MMEANTVLAKTPKNTQDYFSTEDDTKHTGNWLVLAWSSSCVNLASMFVLRFLWTPMICFPWIAFAISNIKASTELTGDSSSDVGSVAGKIKH